MTGRHRFTMARCETLQFFYFFVARKNASFFLKRSVFVSFGAGACCEIHLSSFDRSLQPCESSFTCRLFSVTTRSARSSGK